MTLAKRLSPASRPLVEGNPFSFVRVLMYEDLQCGDCLVLRQMMDSTLLPKFGSRVAFEHRDFPLPKHSWARGAAQASHFFAAIEPELAVEFQRLTLTGRREITPESLRRYVADFARAHGQGPVKAARALTDPATAAAVEASYREGQARGVKKTPTVFVNGEAFVEVFTATAISKSIRAAIAEAAAASVVKGSGRNQ